MMAGLLFFPPEKNMGNKEKARPVSGADSKVIRTAHCQTIKSCKIVQRPPSGEAPERSESEGGLLSLECQVTQNSHALRNHA